MPRRPPPTPSEPAAPQPDKPGLPWLVDLLDRAIKEVPYVRYAFGLVGVAAAAALVVIIFRFVGSEFSGDGSMLGMFILSGFMVVFMFVLFLFARIEDRNKRFLQLPAKIVAWLSVAIVVALVVVATSIGVAQYPPHLADMVFAKPATLARSCCATNSSPARTTPSTAMISTRRPTIPMSSCASTPR